MDCRRIRAISARAENDPEIAREVSAHLAECPACMDELGELPTVFAAPTSAIPPPNLVANIMARLPDATPAQAAALERSRSRRSWVGRGAAAALVVGLLAIGLLGVFVDSSLPASIFGGAESAFGRAILALTLAGKPIVAAFGSLGIPLLLSVALLFGLGNWAWTRLMAAPPALVLAEVER
ncbi:MAG TPA: hypothetical protein VGE07_15270 [Herpetosiphonaceae bacterium]